MATAQNKETEKKFLHNLCNPKFLPLTFKVGVIAVLNVLIGELYRQNFDYNYPTFYPYHDRTEKVSFKHALAESYIPTYHYVPSDYSWVNGERGDYVTFESTPNKRWTIHMIVLLSEALVLSPFAVKKMLRNKQKKLAQMKLLPKEKQY